MSILNGVYFNIRKNFIKASSILSKALDGLDVTPHQVLLLAILDKNERVSNLDLCRLHFLEPSSMSRSLIILKKKGLIDSEKFSKTGTTEGRNLYRISSKGSSVLKKATKLFEKAQESLDLK